LELLAVSDGREYERLELLPTDDRLEYDERLPTETLLRLGEDRLGVDRAE
jgi:hypothetical protein